MEGWDVGPIVIGMLVGVGSFIAWMILEWRYGGGD